MRATRRAPTTITSAAPSSASGRSERKHAVRIAASSAFLVVTLASVAASANPRPLPFTYTTETLPKGEAEVEQFVDLVPLRANARSNGEKTWYVQSQFQTEYEVGLTDRLELGLYVSWVPHPGDAYTDTPTMPEGTGAKQRLRYVFAAP